jgi:DNA-directed RNA polymerase I, II, and III subunit RPABC2
MRSSGLFSATSWICVADVSSYEAEMEAENAEGEEGADGEIDEAMIIVSLSYPTCLTSGISPIFGQYVPTTEGEKQRTGRAAKPNEVRVTTPYMTKYERARVLGTRALQIR